MTNDIPTEVRERAAAKTGFVKHCIRFLGLVVVLMVINLLTSPGYLWFLWVALFGGVGLAAKGIKVFGDLAHLEQNLQSHFEQKEIERHKKS